MGVAGRWRAAGAALVDGGLFALLLGLGWEWTSAQLLAFGAGLAAFALFPGGADPRTASPASAPRVVWRIVAGVWVLALRGGLLATLVRLGLGAPPWLLSAALLTWPALLCLLDRLRAARLTEGAIGDAAVLRLAFTLTGVSVLLRVLYLYPVELMHEEAYYWLYAWHLDYGYVDHPPLVGWMIWAGTRIAGHTELGVRLLAPLFWAGSAWFVFALTRRMFDRTTAWVGVAVYAVLPFYFFQGIVAVPDTPLLFAWAGSVYFLHRMMVDDARHAWVGVGLFLGLGLLAKFTIFLLGFAALLFAAFHPRTRRLFLRWEPYAAIALALLLFLPVLLWNANHEWAAFARQSSDRLGASFKFMLPVLLLFAAVHLTPIGLAGGWSALKTAWRLRRAPASERASPEARGLSLALWLVLVPLSVMVLASFFRNTKFNWTAPMWLPLLPLTAGWLIGPRLDAQGSTRRPDRPALYFAAGLLVIFALGLYYMGVGVPGVGYLQGTAGVGWRDFGGRLEAMANARRRPDGTRPYVVGMNGDTTPSWVSFHRHLAAGAEGGEQAVSETTGRHLFAERCGMFSSWFRVTRMEADALLLVASEAETLERHCVLKRIERADPILPILLEKHGRPAGTWYVRWVYGYSGP